MRLAFSTAAVVLASPVILSATPSTAQTPPAPAFIICKVSEAAPGGGQLLFTSFAASGRASKPEVIWYASSGGILLNLTYGAGPSGAPTRGRAHYRFDTERQPSTDYKMVFDFSGAAPQATLPLGKGYSKATPSADIDIDPHRSPEVMAGFAHAQKVTATVYAGDKQIGQGNFELAPERRAAGLAAFVLKVQAKDSAVCEARSEPPLPVPPVERAVR